MSENKGWFNKMFDFYKKGPSEDPTNEVEKEVEDGKKSEASEEKVTDVKAEKSVVASENDLNIAVDQIEKLKDILKDVDSHIDMTKGDLDTQRDEVKKEVLEKIKEISDQYRIDVPINNAEEEISEIEDKKEVKKMVDDILSGMYILDAERIKGFSGKRAKMANSLEELFGSDMVKTEDIGDKKRIKEIKFTEKEKEFEKAMGVERGKKIWKGILKILGGTATSFGGGLLALTGYGLVASPFVFGVGGSLIGNGAAELAAALDLEKTRRSSRLGIESQDYIRYKKAIDLARKVEKSGYKESEAIAELIEFIHTSEKDSLEKINAFKKMENVDRWVKAGAGFVGGMSASIGSFLYAKGEILKEIMNRGFDFDGNKIYHSISKLKDGYAAIYHDVNEPLEMARKTAMEALKGQGKALTEANISQYVQEFTKNHLTKISLEGGKFGHMLENTESVGRAIANMLNSSKDYIELKYALSGGIIASIMNGLSLRGMNKEKILDKDKSTKLKQLVERYKERSSLEKQAEEDKKQSELEKGQEPFYQAKKGDMIYINTSIEGRSEKYPILYELGELKSDDKNGDYYPTIISNTDQLRLIGFKEEDIEKIKNSKSNLNREEFNKEANKWENKYYSPMELRLLEHYKVNRTELYNRIKIDVEIPFKDKSMMGDLGLDPDKEYAVEKIDEEKNELVLYPEDAPRVASKLIRFKITQILPHINLPTKKFYADSGKKEEIEDKSSKTEAGSPKDDEKIEERSKSKEKDKVEYNVGDKVKFEQFDKKAGGLRELTGKIIEISDEGKYKIELEGKPGVYLYTKKILEKK